MKEFIEPYTPYTKGTGLIKRILGLIPGLSNWIDKKAQEYYTLKKCRHWSSFSNGTVLDLGCGYGQFMECTPSNIKVIGINLNQEEIATARKKGLTIIKADCRKLPFSKNSVHGVNCSHLVEHIIEPMDILKEAKRVLKPGGIVVVRTPDLIRHFKHFYDDPSHINPFTKKKMEKVLVYSGFSNIRVTYGTCTLNWLKPFTIFPKLRVALEELASPVFSHELIAVAEKLD